MAENHYVLSENDYRALKDMMNQWRRRVQSKPTDDEQDRPEPSPDVYVIRLETGDAIPRQQLGVPGVKEDCPVYRLDETYTATDGGDGGVNATGVLTAINFGDDNPFTKRVYNVHERSVSSCQYRIVERLKGGGWTVAYPEFTPYVLVDCKGKLPNVFILNDVASFVGQVVRYAGTCWTVYCSTGFAISGVSPGYVQLGSVTDCSSCGTCYELRPCTGTGPYRYTNTDLSAYVGKVVKPIDDNICYTVYTASNCNSATALGNYDYYQTCTPCAQCYQMENCWDATDHVVVSTDLAKIINVPDGTDVVAGGWVFKFNSKCYKAVAYPYSCAGSIKPVIKSGDYNASCVSCGCFKLTPCTGTAAAIYARSATIGGNSVDLQKLIDGDPKASPPVVPNPYVMLDDKTCWKIEGRDSNCDSTNDITILEAYASCDDCTFYTLTSCVGTTTQKTYTDLKGLGYKLNDIIKLSDSTCWTITNTTSSGTGAVSVTPRGKIPYPSCGDCNHTIPYKLVNTDCVHSDCGGDGTGAGGDPAPDIRTYVSLGDQVGKYVKVAGTCYKVSVDTGTAPADGDDDVYEDAPGFETCEECMAAVQTFEIKLGGQVHWDGTDLTQDIYTMKITGESNCKSTITIDDPEDC